VKVSQLEGVRLDYWVARAEGIPDLKFNSEHGVLVCDSNRWTVVYAPSKIWEQAGLIIEREQIGIAPSEDGLIWYAITRTQVVCSASAALVAAMRAYVASKLGSEVSDEIS
jgi:hypothetical protein